MNKKGLGWHLVVVLAFGLATTAQAALIDRGNGMIYDSDQNLTWLQDANYAKTTGYDADGLMQWDQAVDWADSLVYGGYDDWRLPSVTDSGPLGMDLSNYGTDTGFNVDTGTSEFAYMFHDILGNESWLYPDGSRNEVGCPEDKPFCAKNTSADGVDILNLHSYDACCYIGWWMGTEYALSSNMAWLFSTEYGYQEANGKEIELYAWAVRSGDILPSPVPEPAVPALLLAGLAGLGFVRRRY